MTKTTSSPSNRTESEGGVFTAAPYLAEHTTALSQATHSCREPRCTIARPAFEQRPDKQHDDGQRLGHKIFSLVTERIGIRTTTTTRSVTSGKSSHDDADLIAKVLRLAGLR